MERGLLTYFVENWDTEEVIASFPTEEARNIWLKNYTHVIDDDLYPNWKRVLDSDESVRVAIYEE